MEINVTQEYIDNGESHSISHCPVSNAVRDALSAKAVITTVSKIRVRHSDNSWGCYLTPPNVLRFMSIFDEVWGENREVARPFTFELQEEEIAP